MTAITQSPRKSGFRAIDSRCVQNRQCAHQARICNVKSLGIGRFRCRCRHSSCCSPWPSFTVALPFCHLEFRAARSKSATYPKQINSLGDHLRARRLDLNLLQKQVADQIGVHELTITNWEVNATVPEVRYMPAVIEFLG